MFRIGHLMQPGFLVISEAHIITLRYWLPFLETSDNIASRTILVASVTCSFGLIPANSLAQARICHREDEFRRVCSRMRPSIALVAENRTVSRTGKHEAPNLLLLSDSSRKHASSLAKVTTASTSSQYMVLINIEITGF